MNALLDARGIVAGYGLLEVVHGVDLSVEPHEWVALIGIAGAGKSTLMKALAGVLEAKSGTIRFDGEDMTARPAHARTALGIALVPEGRRLFAGMTVDENLTAGAHRIARRAEVEDARERAFALFPRLRDRRRQVAGTLSGGEAQMCAIARGLMSRPRLLLVDELSLGLAPVVVEELLVALDRIRAEGTALLVVEQDVEAALRLASRAYVMSVGRIALSGGAAEVRAAEIFTASFMGL